MRFLLTYCGGPGNYRLVSVMASGAFEAIRLGRRALVERLGDVRLSWGFELVELRRARS